MEKTKKKDTKKTTIKQKLFVDKYIETKNGTKAAREVYNTKNDAVAWVIASENLRKPKIKSEIEHRIKKAKEMIFKLSQWAKKEEVKLKASQDIVDRWEGKAVQTIKTDPTTNINIFTASDDELLEFIKK